MSKEIFYLKKGFDELGISAKTIEKDLEVSQSFVSNILNGKKAIGGSIAVRLHELYNLDLYWLLTGKGTKIINNQKDINKIPLDVSINKNTTDHNDYLESIITKQSTEIDEIKFKLRVLSSISTKAFELLFENFDMETLNTEEIERQVRSQLNSEL